ncbi:MAG: alpha/beta fold hydrolase [Corynebacterium sp.]|nr:alpha/beta fold hydrolase [Corynebacterium sp.]
MKAITRRLCGLLTAVATFGAGVGLAHASEHATWTGMGAQLPESTNVAQAMLTARNADKPSPLGANEVCTPAPGENPVILLHGMNSDAYGSFARLSPALKEAGKCVYAFTYGEYDLSLMGKMPGFNGMAPLEDSLVEVGSYVDAVRANTGAEKVDLVGYSAGGSLSVAYAKQQGAAVVGNVVTIAGVNRGTSLLGLSQLERILAKNGLQVVNATDRLIGPVGGDLLENSDFMMRLKDGGIEAPGVHYAAISTLYDEAATPLSNTQFSSGNYENIVVQNGCAQDRADHLSLPYDPRAIAYTVNALGGDVQVPCSSVLPVVPLY